MPTADVGCQAGAPSLEHGVASASQKRTLHVINGKVQAARAELSKLIDRHAKLSACVEAGVAQLRAMLQAREAHTCESHTADSGEATSPGEMTRSWSA